VASEQHPRLRASALVGELVGTELASVSVIGQPALKLDDPEKRRDLIARARAGEHIELELHARVFRQKDGAPNRNHLRFKADKLGDIATSFVGMPVLLDHNTYEQAARIGTITASEAEEQGHGWVAFKQTLKIVKSAAVISVLDGTLDRFSIGWHPTGPVLCSVHGVDVRSWKERSKAECYCWPGDRVSVERDGKKTTATVEFEFQSADGIEVSAVNVPAVKGTRIEDVREALALELGLQLHDIPAREKETQMLKFALLATALGVPSLAAAEDEAAAVRAAEDLRRRALAAEQERDEARTALTAAKESLAKDRETMLKASVDTMIETAYRDGKLRYGRDDQGKATPSTRETRLRRIAKDDGLGALKAEIDDMPQIVPVQKRALDAENDVRDRGELDVDDAIASAAAQLGLDPDELAEHHANLYAEQEG
jgi:hypothetical protein